jgi:hypothetical protein
LVENGVHKVVSFCAWGSSELWLCNYIYDGYMVRWLARVHERFDVGT